ncbi:hypothetical protein SAMN05421736_13014 [Evansella caseinilytica]|uniref:Uncharacterized protein n=1 Tax=Evansella caseinilytica TaxID=1503961 RepID=A0A1H3V0J3_9BACI|nr:hypothetical protein [Evansella caseinilytica]SDZ67555.1 hypothetical protein SAMN05421736_13014 [Evansella caseinilytica]
MDQRQQQKDISKKLNGELSHFHFSGNEEVIRKTHPKTLRDRLMRWWNKEISIPLVPLGMAALLLFSTAGAYVFSVTKKPEHEQISTIEIRTENGYWLEFNEKEAQNE